MWNKYCNNQFYQDCISEYAMIHNSIEKQFKLDYNNVLISLIDSMGYDIAYTTENQLLDIKTTSKTGTKLIPITTLEDYILMKDIYYMGTNCVEHYRLEQVQDLDAKFRMYEVLLQYGTDNKISDTNILLDVDL